MPIIQCACGDNDCPVWLWFSDGNLMIKTKTGEEQLIYMDVDSLSDLMAETSQVIREKTHAVSDLTLP